MTHAGAACSRCVNACSLINSIAFTKTRHVPYLNIEDQSWLPACCTSGRGVCSTNHPHGLHLQTMWCCLLQIGFSLAPLLPSAWKDMAAWVRVFSFSFVVQVCEYTVQWNYIWDIIFRLAQWCIMKFALMMVSENDVRCDFHLQERFLCLHMFIWKGIDIWIFAA